MRERRRRSWLATLPSGGVRRSGRISGESACPRPTQKRGYSLRTCCSGRLATRRSTFEIGRLRSSRRYTGGHWCFRRLRKQNLPPEGLCCRSGPMKVTPYDKLQGTMQSSIDDIQTSFGGAGPSRRWCRSAASSAQKWVRPRLPYSLGYSRPASASYFRRFVNAQCLAWSLNLVVGCIGPRAIAYV